MMRPVGFDREYVIFVMQHLSEMGTSIEPGLSDGELIAVETAVGAAMPPELRLLWSVGFPTGDDWPIWRSDAAGQANRDRQWIDHLFQSDIEENDYWHREWGPRPARNNEALGVARAALVRWPPLIRVYSNRFMTTYPYGWGNPVLSVYQAIDTIFYGHNLAHYVSHEFGLPLPAWADTPSPSVPHWGDAFDLREGQPINDGPKLTPEFRGRLQDFIRLSSENPDFLTTVGKHIELLNDDEFQLAIRPLLDRLPPSDEAEA